MLKMRVFAWSLPASLMVLSTGVIFGQPYPNKPVRIVATEPGSAGDYTARQIAQGISPSLGQPAIVDNRSGTVAVETVAKALPDGYTLLFYGSTIWIEPLIRKVSWDPVRDFLPITLATSTPLLVIVYPSLPVKSVRELI